LPVASALCAGYVLFVSCTAFAVWRTGGAFLLPRMLILAISAVGVMFTIGQSPQIALGIIASSLMAISYIEWSKCRHS